MAEFANFPQSVVALAREKAAELEDFTPLSNDLENQVFTFLVLDYSCFLRFQSLRFWFLFPSKMTIFGLIFALLVPKVDILVETLTKNLI